MLVPTYVHTRSKGQCLTFGKQVTPTELMSPTCHACLKWGGGPIHGRRQEKFQERANPSFVVFNGHNRNILHVLMVTTLWVMRRLQLPLTPLWRRLSTLVRPCARWVVKSIKYQNVDNVENWIRSPPLTRRARHPLHQVSTKQKV